MTDEAAFDHSDLVSLDEKLASLDLTERELAAFAAYLGDPAEEAEVTGFATGGLRFLPRLNPTITKGFYEAGDLNNVVGSDPSRVGLIDMP